MSGYVEIGLQYKLKSHVYLKREVNNGDMTFSLCALCHQ